MNLIRSIIICSISLLVTPAYAAFDFDAEMGAGASTSTNAASKSSKPTSSGFDFDAEMGGESKQPSHSDNPLDDVIHGRTAIKDKASQQSFAKLSKKLDSECRCSVSNSGCSRAMNLNHYKTDRYLNEAGSLLKKVDDLCLQWEGNKGQAFSSFEKRNKFTKLWQSNSKTVASLKGSLSSSLSRDSSKYASVERERKKELRREREREEERAERRRERASAPSGNPWARGIMEGLQEASVSIAETQRQIAESRRVTDRMEADIRQKRQRQAERAAERRHEQQEATQRARSREMQQRRDSARKQQEAREQRQAEARRQRELTRKRQQAAVAAHNKQMRDSALRIANNSRPILVYPDGSIHQPQDAGQGNSQRASNVSEGKVTAYTVEAAHERQAAAHQLVESRTVYTGYVLHCTGAVPKVSFGKQLSDSEIVLQKYNLYAYTINAQYNDRPTTKEGAWQKYANERQQKNQHVAYDKTEVEHWLKAKGCRAALEFTRGSTSPSDSARLL